MNIFDTDLPEEIYVDLDGRKGVADTQKYILAKTKQLREFGYPELTFVEVAKEIEKILSGKKLTVIGMMMEGEIKPLSTKPK